MTIIGHYRATPQDLCVLTTIPQLQRCNTSQQHGSAVLFRLTPDKMLAGSGEKDVRVIGQDVLLPTTHMLLFTQPVFVPQLPNALF